MRGGGGRERVGGQGWSSGSEWISTTASALRRGLRRGEACFSSSRVAKAPALVAGGETGRSAFLTVARGRLARLASALRLMEVVRCGFVGAASELCWDCDAW